MKKSNLVLSALIFSMSCSLIFGREIDLDNPSSKLRRFASDVIYVVEAGNQERYSKRLRETLTIEFHGQQAPKPIAEKHLADFILLTGLKVADKPIPSEATTKIDFYFGTQVELAKTAREIDREINVGRGYTYWTWWDPDKKIKRAVLMIATDKLSGPALEDRLIEELLGVFGLPARSGEVDESCLSSKESIFTVLQPIDRALLSFYYRAVPAGTRPSVLSKIIEENWNQKR